MYYEFMML